MGSRVFHKSGPVGQKSETHAAEFSRGLDSETHQAGDS